MMLSVKVMIMAAIVYLALYAINKTLATMFLGWAISNQLFYGVLVIIQGAAGLTAIIAAIVSVVLW